MFLQTFLWSELYCITEIDLTRDLCSKGKTMQLFVIYLVRAKPKIKTLVYLHHCNLQKVSMSPPL
jgi:hypothetical protein